MTQEYKYILYDEGKDYICENYFNFEGLRHLFNNTLWTINPYHDTNILIFCKSTSGISIIFNKEDPKDKIALSLFKEASEEELLIIDIIS